MKKGKATKSKRYHKQMKKQAYNLLSKRAKKLRYKHAKQAAWKNYQNKMKPQWAKVREEKLVSDTLKHNSSGRPLEAHTEALAV